MTLRLHGTYGVTSDKYNGLSHLDSARVFLDGGFKIIQYRGKRPDGTELQVREQIKHALEIKELCRSYGAAFIVNDRLDVALEVGADGLHIGQDDIPMKTASKAFNGLIGISVSTAKQAMLAEHGGASYLGVGTVFPSGTKKEGEPIIGLEGLADICRLSPLPKFAIGGIEAGLLPSIHKAGADGIAVISAVLRHESGYERIAAARDFLRRWEALEA